MSLENSPGRPGTSYRTPDASMTIDEFCQAERVLDRCCTGPGRKGWGPTFYRIGTTRRITHRARMDWQREREAAAAAATEGGTK